MLTLTQCLDNERQVDEGREDDVQLVVAREYPPEPLQLPEQAPHLVVTLVDILVAVPEILAVPFRGGTIGDTLSSATKARVSSPSYALFITTLSAVGGVAASSFRPAGTSSARPPGSEKLTAVRSSVTIRWIFVVHSSCKLRSQCCRSPANAG